MVGETLYSMTIFARDDWTPQITYRQARAYQVRKTFLSLSVVRQWPKEETMTFGCGIQLAV